MPGPLSSRFAPGAAIHPAASLLAASSAVWAATQAHAHGAERGFVLLLPTTHYLAGGAAAVAASFLLVALAPSSAIDRLARARLRLGTVPDVSPVPFSLAAFGVFALLLAAGFLGSRDPLANPLPLAIWTIWWVGITLLHAILGDLWAFINPWTGPYRLLDRFTGGRLRALLAYPEWLGYWPAIVFFFGFAWLELVDPTPDDPERLAKFAGLYWLAAFAGMVVFGERAWREKAEPFSIFFRLVAGLSPLVIGPASTGRRDVGLVLPGAALVARDPLPLSGILFVLLSLSSVSFDGLSRTFWWLAMNGINPLEFPGRSAVVGRNTAGLLLTFAALTIGYVSAVALGTMLAGRTRPLNRLGLDANLRRGGTAFSSPHGGEAAPARSGGVGEGGGLSANSERAAPPHPALSPQGRGEEAAADVGVQTHAESALAAALGRFVFSIVPISVAFHFSHYLPALLVDGQYALAAAADPFDTGLDLLGRFHVTTSFLNTYEGVRAIWNLQTAGIVLGHVAGIALAHALALCHFGDGRRAAISQIPLALLMVLYTLFGLWLLSTPAVG